MRKCFTFDHSFVLKYVLLTHDKESSHEVKISRRILTIHHRSAFRTLSDIKDAAFCKNNQQLEAVNYFHKTFHLIYLAGF